MSMEAALARRLSAAKEEVALLRGDLASKLMDLNPEERLREVRQLLIDLMDYTEQTDEEEYYVNAERVFRWAPRSELKEIDGQVS